MDLVDKLIEEQENELILILDRCDLLDVIPNIIVRMFVIQYDDYLCTLNTLFKPETIIDIGVSYQLYQGID